MIDILVLLAIICIVCIAGWYVLSQIALPEPARRIVTIVFVVVVAIVAIMILLNLTGIATTPLRLRGGA